MNRLLASTTLFAACILSGAAAAETVTLRLSHWVPATHPVIAHGLEPWTKAVTEDSNGSIQFQIFPSAQLGKAEDHFDMARDGIVDVAWLNPGFNPGRFSIFAGIQVPLTVSDGIAGTEALSDWYAPYAAQEMGDVHFCLAHTLTPITFHSKQRIEQPSDLAGKKIRPSSAMEGIYIREAGGSAVPGSNPEAREMLSRGLIDATTGTPDSQFVFGVVDAVKYHLDMPFGAVSFALVMNRARYDGLDPEQKAAIDKNCGTAGAVEHFSEPNTTEKAAMDRLRTLEGHEVVTPSPEVLTEWIAGAEPVREAWRKELSGKGIDPAPVEASLRESLRKTGALLE